MFSRLPWSGCVNNLAMPFGGTVADCALTTDAQGVFESVICLAFVQHNLRPILASSPAGGGDFLDWS